ncbi:GNAT family protein [Aeromicrobium panaciterrae]|uniref:GNAT family N-acetyltransferase n=1 Tax=Aeromicrobium panaciterrae TaxID=363861 RepID=UPI0031DE10B5
MTDLPISTARLTLRAATVEDAAATWPYRRLPEVGEWITELATDEAAYGEKFADPERLASTVIIELDGVVIGDFMIKIQDAWAQAEVSEQAVRSQAELGWTLDPAHMGQGYATEAATALLEYCFETLGVRRITAICFADNAPSVRLIERLGMRLEQRAVKESLHRSGQWLDSLGYAILRDEWLSMRSAQTNA